MTEEESKKLIKELNDKAWVQKAVDEVIQEGYLAACEECGFSADYQCQCGEYFARFKELQEHVLTCKFLDEGEG